MKVKQTMIMFTVLQMTIWVGLSTALSRLPVRSFDSLNQELKYLVSELVDKDNSVRSCVLSVLKGDSSYFWSGAMGIASQENQMPMTKETPIYIASITKLYTAAVIMKL